MPENDLGQGDKFPLVLLPGMDGTGILFRPLLDALPSHFSPRVIPFPDDQTLTYEDLFSYVRARLPDSPFVLLGESFSGPLSIRIARSRPDCQGLILAVTFLRRPVRIVPPWLAGAAQTPFFRNAGRGIGRMFLTSGRPVSPDIATLLAEVRRRAVARTLACRARCALRVDVRDEFRNLEIPVLALQARWDLVIDAQRTATDILQTRPRTDVRWFHSCHLFLQTQPQTAADVINSFCRQRVQMTDLKSL